MGPPEESVMTAQTGLAPVAMRAPQASAAAEITPEAAEALPVLFVRWQLQFTQCSLKYPYCTAEWTNRQVGFQ